ncbi:unnamed protein product, partial [Ceratitis capitata]
ELSNKLTVPTTLSALQRKAPDKTLPGISDENPEERLRESLLGKYYANCLSVANRATSCTSTRRCRRCQGKHHTTLHLQTDDPIDTGPWSVQVAEERHLQIACYTHAESTELTPA